MNPNVQTPRDGRNLRTSRPTSQPSGVSATQWEDALGVLKPALHNRCAVTAARSRAATICNLARASRALVLRALFGAPKSCALVNLFMICPRWSAGLPPDDDQNSVPGSRPV